MKSSNNRYKKKVAVEMQNMFRFYYDNEVFDENGIFRINNRILSEYENEEFEYAPDWQLGFELKLFDSYNGETSKFIAYDNLRTNEERPLNRRSVFEVTHFTPWARSYLPNTFDQVHQTSLQLLDFESTVDTDDVALILIHFMSASFITCDLVNSVETTIL